MGKEYIKEKVEKFGSKEQILEKLDNWGFYSDEMVTADIAYSILLDKKKWKEDVETVVAKTLQIPQMMCENIILTDERKERYIELNKGYETLFPGIKGKFPVYKSIFNQ